MGRLLVLVFLLPWWAYVPASIGVLWLGERVYEQALATEAGKAAALAADAPAPIDLGDFRKVRDIHAAGEVHVTGWIDADLKYELVKSRNGVRINTRFMYMMFGSGDPADAPQVRAALMLTKKQNQVFLDRGEDFIVGFNDAEDFVFGFNGFGESNVTMSGMAADAIEEQGLNKSGDFIFIEPFFDGREAALSPRGIPDRSRYIGWAIAALLALIGVMKRIRSVRGRPSRDELEAAQAAEAENLAPAPAKSFVVPNGVDENTPLGRLARRRSGSAEPVFAQEPASTALDAADPVPVFSEQDSDAAPSGARPQSALVYDSGATLGDDPAGSAPPDPGNIPDPTETPASSALGFYVKLAIAMLLVGGVAYEPSILGTALPFAGVALIWLGVYFVFRKARRGGWRTRATGPAPQHQHQRRPDDGAQTVAVGAHP